MDSDELKFGGHDRLFKGHGQIYKPVKETWHNRSYYVKLYIPSRTAIVLMADENAKKYDIVLPSIIEEVLLPENKKMVNEAVQEPLKDYQETEAAVKQANGSIKESQTHSNVEHLATQEKTNL